MGPNKERFLVNSESAAFVSTHNNVYAFGRGEYEKQVLVYIGSDGDPEVDDESTEKKIKGVGINLARSRDSQNVVYDHTRSGYWMANPTATADTGIGGACFFALLERGMSIDRKRRQ